MFRRRRGAASMTSGPAAETSCGQRHVHSGSGTRIVKVLLVMSACDREGGFERTFSQCAFLQTLVPQCWCLQKREAHWAVS